MISILTTTAAQLDLNSWLNNFDWSSPSWDLFVILFIVFGGLVYGMSLGRDRLALTTIAIYISLALVNAAPFVGHEFAANVHFADYAMDIKIVAFLGLLVIVMFLFARGALFRSLLGSNSSNGFWQSLFLSFTHTGLIVAIVMNYLPNEAVNNFSDLIRNIFYGEWQLFWWLLTPIAVMIIFKIKKKD
jgi:hypothetical protein